MHFFFFFFYCLNWRENGRMNCISNPYKFRPYNGTEWRRMFFGAISQVMRKKTMRFYLLDYKRLWPTAALVICKSERSSSIFR